MGSQGFALGKWQVGSGFSSVLSFIFLRSSLLARAEFLMQPILGGRDDVRRDSDEKR